MASLPPSQPVSGGSQPPPAPNITHNNNSNDGGEGNRKRKAEEASLDEEEALVSVSNVSMLPTAVLAIAVSFLPSKDRLSVSSTCRDLNKAVETFSEMKLNELRQRAQRADDDDDETTWDECISNQDSIKTERPKPLSQLPFRYLLSKASRTYLYCFEDVRYSCPTPDGNGLVVRVDRPTTALQKIDLDTNLQTKKKERSLVSGEYAVSKAEDMSMVDDRVVWVARTPHGDSDFQALAVSNVADGALLSLLELPKSSGHVSLLGANRTKAILQCYGESIASVCLKTARPHFKEMEERAQVKHVVVFDDFCVVIGTLKQEPGQEEPNQRGIHVFDANDLRLIHFMPGSFFSVTKPSVSGERTIVVKDTNGKFQVFDLADDGQLSTRGWFEFPGARQNIPPLLHKSFVYVSASNRDKNHVVRAYNINHEDGKPVQTFKFPVVHNFHVKTSTNGREIFFSPGVANGRLVKLLAFPLCW